MTDDRDQIDARLLAEGRHSELLAAYWPSIISRLLLRMDEREAYEVASDVAARLLEELSRGRRYPVPFRVVVWKVTGWCVKDHYAASKRRNEVALPDDWQPPVDGGFDGAVGEMWVREVITKHLTGRQYEVAWLVYVEVLSIQQAADRLGITRNAADQALHNAHATLRRQVTGV